MTQKCPSIFYQNIFSNYLLAKYYLCGRIHWTRGHRKVNTTKCPVIGSQQLSQKTSFIGSGFSNVKTIRYLYTRNVNLLLLIISGTAQFCPMITVHKKNIKPPNSPWINFRLMSECLYITRASSTLLSSSTPLLHITRASSVLLPSSKPLLYITRASSVLLPSSTSFHISDIILSWKFYYDWTTSFLDVVSRARIRLLYPNNIV